MDQVSQECFSSSLLLQVHTRFVHDLWFCLSGMCKAELLTPVLAREDESTPQLAAPYCFRKNKEGGCQTSYPKKLPL